MSIVSPALWPGKPVKPAPHFDNIDKISYFVEIYPGGFQARNLDTELVILFKGDRSTGVESGTR